MAIGEGVLFFSQFKFVLLLQKVQKKTNEKHPFSFPCRSPSCFGSSRTLVHIRRRTQSRSESMRSTVVLLVVGIAIVAEGFSPRAPFSTTPFSSTSLTGDAAGTQDGVASAPLRDVSMAIFGKKEPLNPEDGGLGPKKPSVWTASAIQTPVQKPAAKKPAPRASRAQLKKNIAANQAAASSSKVPAWKARRQSKDIVDPYSGRRGGGNYGRDDYMDVSNQDEAGFLPDFIAGFFYDKSVGGPQRDLESIVATQLFFATFILTPALLYATGVLSF